MGVKALLLNGPGGNGSTRGNGGNRRIVVSSCRSASQRNVNEFSVLCASVSAYVGSFSEPPGDTCFKSTHGNGQPQVYSNMINIYQGAPRSNERGRKGRKVESSGANKEIDIVVIYQCNA